MSVKIIPFYGLGSPFSNFYITHFKQDFKDWCCSEQYYLYYQAIYCKNKDIADGIYKSKWPTEMKRMSKGVDQEMKKHWFKSGEAAKKMRSALLSKFEQNEHICSVLLETGDGILVEASPIDDFWGVKLDMYDLRILDPCMWRGENWLGNLLMEVREQLGGCGSPLWPDKWK